ncbi:SLBB domain-containing protein [Flavobacteriaceae bacterium]|nr:SLBB domain-containing protein [Flavobacteriaceae bacterium]MDC1459502.1 SLBB domain-containing protein [Flavobacteriaceae bacterium]MDC3221094.1 SLBB domain-containing protein [Flavobacteriaceae bacterium]
MFKKTLCIVILFLSFNSFGQEINELRNKASNSSDTELIVFIQKAKDQGLSLLDAEKQLILIGGKAEEIKKLRNLWNKKISQESQSLEKNENIIQSNFGDNESFVKDSLKQDVEDELKRFGSDFFKNKNIVESPQLFVATPDNYRLGPGDEIIIDLYGSSEISYTQQISREGFVKIERVAPVFLSGLTINSAKKLLKSKMSKTYSGLNSNNVIDKVNLELNLKKARSIVVNITGQVEAPGTYTISGFSSVLNALYAAGGPNDVGTYRDINIIRNGKVVHNVDLYDYFSNGIYPNVYLRDQDVILVKPYKIQTEIVSGFKQLALFEIKKDEVVSDLINHSGGASSNAYKSTLFIERFDDFSLKIVEVNEKDFKNIKLNDGDKISFKEINKENVFGGVKIGGAVYLSGSFQLDKNKSVNDLINSSKGLTNDFLGDNAILYRSNKGLDDLSISINLKDDNDLSILLFENDSLYIPSSKDILFEQFIEIKGEVNFPKEIDFRFGYTITDLIILSGGLTTYANKNDIRIFRNISGSGNKNVTEEIVVSLDENLIPNKKIILQPDDIVTVNTFPYRKENKFYSIKGEVALPGLYSIKNQSYSVYDAINDNIEFLNSSSISGISIVRDSIRIPVNGNKLISQGKKSRYNFELVSGDEIIIPSVNNTVVISGEVQQEGIINIYKPVSAKTAIESVGGFTNKSVKKEVYVEYQNGLRKVTKSFLFFNFYPRVLPGSKVVVPEKSENENKTSVGDIVGYTTSLVSIIALIKSF